MPWQDFFKDPENWMKLISSGLSAAEARDKSKNTLSPQDLWAIGNPSVNTPFYNTQTDWNRGNPTENRQMTPNLQQAFDKIIWGALAQGRDPYGKSEDLNKLQYLQNQNQLGRYGEVGDPYSPKPEAGGREEYDPIGMIGGGDDGGRDNDRGGDEYPDTRNPNNGNQNAMDEIQRAIREREAQEARDAADNTSPAGYDNYRSGGWEEFMKHAIRAGLDYKVGMGSGELWDRYSEDQNWFGNNRGLIAPDSRDYLTRGGVGQGETPFWSEGSNNNWWSGRGNRGGIIDPNSPDFVTPNDPAYSVDIGGGRPDQYREGRTPYRNEYGGFSGGDYPSDAGIPFRDEYGGWTSPDDQMQDRGGDWFSDTQDAWWRHRGGKDGDDEEGG